MCIELERLLGHDLIVRPFGLDEGMVRVDVADLSTGRMWTDLHWSEPDLVDSLILIRMDHESEFIYGKLMHLAVPDRWVLLDLASQLSSLAEVNPAMAEQLEWTFVRADAWLELHPEFRARARGEE